MAFRPSNARVASPLAIIVIAVVLALVLYLLYPGHALFNNAKKQQYSGLSIQYLQQLLKARPHDQRLRIALAHQLVSAGELSHARKTIAPLRGQKSQKIQWITLEIDWASYIQATPGTDKRKALRIPVEKDLAVLESEFGLSNKQLETIARRRLALEQPDKAAELYERLARQDSAQRYHWLSQAASWWTASNKPNKAASDWMLAMESTNQLLQKHSAALNALKAARSVGNARSLVLSKRLIKTYPDDSDILNAAIVAARNENRPDLALQWSKHYLHLHPDDDKALSRQVDIALASNKPDVALRAIDRLTSRHPDNLYLQQRKTTIALDAGNLSAALMALQAQQHLGHDTVHVDKQIAQVEQWSNQPEKALKQWQALARKHPSPAYDRHIIKLGQSTYDMPAVVAALRRESRRRRLTPADMKLYVDSLDGELGEPDKAITALKKWLRPTSADQPLWRRLAQLYTEKGLPVRALHTWARIARIYGNNPTNVSARAQIETELWQFGRAQKTLASLDRKPSDPGYWRLLGDLAWHRNDMATVVNAYGWLKRNDHLDDTRGPRLAIAALRQGDKQLALSATASSWHRYHQPGTIVNLLGIAESSNDYPFMAKVFSLANERANMFNDSAEYWSDRGDYLSTLGHYGKARLAYRKALKISPGDGQIRAALLYALIGAGDNKQLSGELKRWHAYAADDSRLWEPYAIGYAQLGLTRAALPWFYRYGKAHPKNYLWLLDYADALDKAELRADAYKIRRYALLHLRPKVIVQASHAESRAKRQRDNRVLLAQQSLLGGASNVNWLKHVLRTRNVEKLGPVDTELLIDWHLAESQPAYARFWLLRARMKRLKSPAYQQLAVALASNDHRAIARILAHSGSSLDVADRVIAERRIHHDDQALLTALNHINDREAMSPDTRTSLQRNAAELYRKMPQNFGLKVSGTRIGGLTLSTEQGNYKRSSRNWTVGVKARSTQFSGHLHGLSIGALSPEYGAGLSLIRREHRGSTQAELGRVETRSVGFITASLSQSLHLSERLTATAFGHYNNQVNDTGEIRVLGTRSSFGLNLDFVLSARDALSLQGQGLRYQTRRGHFLGEGYQLEGTFSRALFRGETNEIDAFVDTSYMHNTLSATLPSDAASHLPSGAEVSSIVPKEFGNADVGLAISRGQPGSEYPEVGGLRYHAEASLGYVWPDDSLGVNASLGIGHQLFGSDALSLNLFYSQTQTANSESTEGAAIEYKYFLGK